MSGRFLCERLEQFKVAMETSGARSARIFIQNIMRDRDVRGYCYQHRLGVG